MAVSLAGLDQGMRLCLRDVKQSQGSVKRPNTSGDPDILYNEPSLLPQEAASCLLRKHVLPLYLPAITLHAARRQHSSSQCLALHVQGGPGWFSPGSVLSNKMRYTVLLRLCCQLDAFPQSASAAAAPPLTATSSAMQRRPCSVPQCCVPVPRAAEAQPEELAWTEHPACLHARVSATSKLQGLMQPGSICLRLCSLELTRPPGARPSTSVELWPTNRPSVATRRPAAGRTRTIIECTMGMPSARPPSRHRVEEEQKDTLPPTQGWGACVLVMAAAAHLFLGSGSDSVHEAGKQTGSPHGLLGLGQVCQLPHAQPGLVLQLVPHPSPCTIPFSSISSISPSITNWDEEGV